MEDDCEEGSGFFNFGPLVKSILIHRFLLIWFADGFFSMMFVPKVKLTHSRAKRCLHKLFRDKFMPSHSVINMSGSIYSLDILKFSCCTLDFCPFSRSKLIWKEGQF